MATVTTITSTFGTFSKVNININVDSATVGCDSYQLIFVCDVSGSMQGQRLQMLNRFMRTVLKNVLDDRPMGLVLFDHKVKYASGIFKGRRTLNDDDLRKLEKADGGTNFNNVFQYLRKNMPQHKDTIIVFCTDGETNMTDVLNAKRHLEELTKQCNITFHSIGIGNNLDVVFLERLAEGFGTIHYIDSLDDETMDSLLTVICDLAPFITNGNMKIKSGQFFPGVIEGDLFFQNTKINEVSIKTKALEDLKKSEEIYEFLDYVIRRHSAKTIVSTENVNLLNQLKKVIYGNSRLSDAHRDQLLEVIYNLQELIDQHRSEFTKSVQQKLSSLIYNPVKKLKKHKNLDLRKRKNENEVDELIYKKFTIEEIPDSETDQIDSFQCIVSFKTAREAYLEGSVLCICLEHSIYHEATYYSPWLMKIKRVTEYFMTFHDFLTSVHFAEGGNFLTNLDNVKVTSVLPLYLNKVQWSTTGYKFLKVCASIIATGSFYCGTALQAEILPLMAWIHLALIPKPTEWQENRRQLVEKIIENIPLVKQDGLPSPVQVALHILRGEPIDIDEITKKFFREQFKDTKIQQGLKDMDEIIQKIENNWKHRKYETLPIDYILSEEGEKHFDDVQKQFMASQTGQLLAKTEIPCKTFDTIQEKNDYLLSLKICTDRHRIIEEWVKHFKKADTYLKTAVIVQLMAPTVRKRIKKMLRTDFNMPLYKGKIGLIEGGGYVLRHEMPDGQICFESTEYIPPIIDFCFEEVF